MNVMWTGKKNIMSFFFQLKESLPVRNANLCRSPTRVATNGLMKMLRTYKSCWQLHSEQANSLLKT